MKFESFRFTLCHRKAAFRADISDSSQSLNATPDGLFRSLLLIFFKFHFNGCEKLRLELQLHARLEKLCLADKIEAVQRAVSIRKLKTDIVRHMPVHHRCNSPEFSPSDWT